jgi:hypothetical protein
MVAAREANRSNARARMADSELGKTNSTKLTNDHLPLTADASGPARFSLCVLGVAFGRASEKPPPPLAPHGALQVVWRASKIMNYIHALNHFVP